MCAGTALQKNIAPNFLIATESWQNRTAGGRSDLRFFSAALAVFFLFLR
jgi:hypothetical protein